MIPYNFVYRGAFEYDKFVLNIFQFHNQAMSLVKELDKGPTSKLNELTENVDSLFNEILSMDMTSEILAIRMLIE